MITMRNITKSYEMGTQVVHALRGVDLEIGEGEFVAIMGPSGSGKSTLMNMIGCLDVPTGGTYLLDGIDVSEMTDNEQARIRNQRVGFVFQNFNLLPRTSALKQVALPLMYAGMGRRERNERAHEVLQLVGLGDRTDHRPDELSGGQQQRVAFARAIVFDPDIILMDEPLGALDRKLRESTQRELLDLQRRLGLTFVVVTHDQDEAMTMADRIGVMNAGRLEQVATPRHLYEEPVSRWIAGFVGDVNMFDGKVARRDGGRFAVAVPGVGLLNATPPRDPAGVEAVSVAIRPEKVRLSRRPPVADVADASINRLEGVVRDIGYLGGASLYTVALDGDAATLRASVANTARLDADAFPVGQRIAAWFSADDCVVLER